MVPIDITDPNIASEYATPSPSVFVVQTLSFGEGALTQLDVKAKTFLKIFSQQNISLGVSIGVVYNNQVRVQVCAFTSHLYHDRHYGLAIMGQQVRTATPLQQLTLSIALGLSPKYSHRWYAYVSHREELTSQESGNNSR